MNLHKGTNKRYRSPHLHADLCEMEYSDAKQDDMQLEVQ